MTDISNFIPLIVLIGAVLGGRLIAERALMRLSREQKGLVVEAFSAMRQANVLILAVLVFCAIWRPTIGFALVVIYFAAVGLYSIRRLKALDIPKSYGNAYAASMLLQLAGFASYFTFLFRG